MATADNPLTDVVVRQRNLIRQLIEAWPGGKDSVSFAGVARQVREVMSDASIDWKDLGGPPPKGRCGYEQYEPNNESATPITEQQALEGINAIRNSIVGCQQVNWSEHIYPLVSLLNRAGYEGLSHAEAKKNIGTLIDQNSEAREIIKSFVEWFREHDGKAGDFGRLYEVIRAEEFLGDDG